MSFLRQFFLFLFIVLLISFIDYRYIGTGVIGIDDGNIFLNYARHFAHGEGFVFNTNGETVEGFTSLLWVLICAAAYTLTEHPELLLIGFSLLLTTLIITNVFISTSKDVLKLYPSFYNYYLLIYCGFIMAIGPSFIAWSVLSLMENALWNFIFISLAMLVPATVQLDDISIRRKVVIILLGCLLTLTRPEALAWNLVFFSILLFTSIQNKRRIYFPVLYFICIACVTAGLTLFRLHYFGFQFPNTYYAKISPDRIYNFTEGAKYAFTFLAGYQPVISFLFVLMNIVLLFGLFKLKLLNRNIDESLTEGMILKKGCIITLIILSGFILPCTTGGDHFGGFRFYQGLLLLFAWGIVLMTWLFKAYLFNRPGKKMLGVFIISIYLLIVGSNNLIELKNPAKTQLNFEFLLAQQGRDLAEKLNRALPLGKPSVGIIAVGGFGLQYKGATVDLMGLNNIAMAHSPGDRKGIKNHAAFNKDIFYQLKPDILLPENIAGFKEATIKYFNLLDVNNFDNQAMKNIFNDEEFQKLYYPVFIFDKKNKAGFFAFASINFTGLLKDDLILSVQRINEQRRGREA